MPALTSQLLFAHYVSAHSWMCITRAVYTVTLWVGFTFLMRTKRKIRTHRSLFFRVKSLRLGLDIGTKAWRMASYHPMFRIWNYQEKGGNRTHLGKSRGIFSSWHQTSRSVTSNPVPDFVSSVSFNHDYLISSILDLCYSITLPAILLFKIFPYMYITGLFLCT